MSNFVIDYWATAVIPPDPDPTIIDVITMQGGGNVGDGFALIAYDTTDDTWTTTSTLVVENASFLSRPFALGDEFFAMVYNAASTDPFVRIYRDDGAGSFELMDQTVNIVGRVGVGAVGLSDTRFVALYKMADNSFEADLCNWEDEVITVVDTAIVASGHGTPPYLMSTLCQGKAIFLHSGVSSNRFLICTMSGDTLSCAYSTAAPSNTEALVNGMCAVGDKIQLAKGHIWSFSGTDMTEVQPSSDVTDYNTSDDSRFFALNKSFAEVYWRLAASPYTATLIATQFKSVPGGGYGYVFIPGDDQSFGANNHGAYKFNGTTFIKQADFEQTWDNVGDINNLVATPIRLR